MDQDRRHRIRLCLAIGLFGLLMPAACTGAPQPKGEAVDITLRDFHINTGTPSVTSGDVVFDVHNEAPARMSSWSYGRISRGRIALGPDG